jgi:hypothetical protein
MSQLSSGVSGVGEDAQALMGQAGTSAEQGASAVESAASESLDATMEGMRRVRSRLEEAAQGLPSAPTSTRLAWRMGRWLGRVEGALWLASKGAGVWWGRTMKQLRGQPPNQRLRLIAQWGPCVVASAWLVAQIGNRARRAAD